MNGQPLQVRIALRDNGGVADVREGTMCRTCGKVVGRRTGRRTFCLEHSVYAQHLRREINARETRRLRRLRGVA
jgi:hypothetical protein